MLKYILEKGSIAIDGISLTVADVTESDFAVSVIPHTGAETTLLSKEAGDIVNLENDVIGKYVDKLLRFQAEESETEKKKTKDSGITMDFLAKNGF